MTAPLKVDALVAGYGREPVLSHISLQVQPGEAWVILGPNGSGKSTLARAIMGLLPFTEGSVTVCGLPLPGTSAKEIAKHAAWVPQNIDEATSFTGLELVLMGRAPHLSAWGVPSQRDEAVALQAMESLEVSHLASRPLSEVSGGERRRVWVARALVQEPTLLVLDEPTAFLDVRHQIETLQVVQERVAAGLSVVAVLHDVNLASHFATHVLLLKDGQCMAQGPREQVLNAEQLSALYDVPMQMAGGIPPIFVPQWAHP